MDERFYNMMFQIYHTTKQPELAWKLFQKMITEEKQMKLHSFSYYPLLLSLKEAGNMEEQIQMVYHYMKLKKVEIKTSHLQAMGWDVTRILDEASKYDGLSTSQEYNSLISYAVKKNEFETALTIFNQMQTKSIEPDVFTYSIVMDALNKDVDQPVERVYDIYEEIKAKGILPDPIVYSCLLQACGRQGDSDRAIRYLQEMVAYQVQPNDYILNAYLSLLTRKPILDHQDIEQAKSMWDLMLKMKIYPNTRSYNNYFALISRIVPKVDQSRGYQEEEGKEEEEEEEEEGKDQVDILEVKDQAMDKIYQTDYHSDTSSHSHHAIMNGLGSRPMSPSALYMMKLYRDMCRSRLKAQPDFATYAILINTMLSHGQTRKAMALYRDAQEATIKLPVTVYNQIMQGLLDNRDLHQVMQLWQDMKADDVLPDEKSYQLVLDTCQQLHLTKSLKAIQVQYQLDQPRLKKLQLARENRVRNARSMNNQN